MRGGGRLRNKWEHHIIFTRYELVHPTGVSENYSMQREKERDLTQSYDENPYTNRKFNNQLTTQRRQQKLRLRNDCGPTPRSVRVTTAIQLVLLNRIPGTLTSHLSQQPCNQKNPQLNFFKYSSLPK